MNQNLAMATKEYTILKCKIIRYWMNAGKYHIVSVHLLKKKNTKYIVIIYKNKSVKY